MLKAMRQVVMMAEGMIKIEEGGVYEFALTSDDGSSVTLLSLVARSDPHLPAVDRRLLDH